MICFKDFKIMVGIAEASGPGGGAGKHCPPCSP